MYNVMNLDSVQAFEKILDEATNVSRLNSKPKEKYERQIKVRFFIWVQDSRQRFMNATITHHQRGSLPVSENECKCVRKKILVEYWSKVEDGHRIKIVFSSNRGHKHSTFNWCSDISVPYQYPSARRRPKEYRRKVDTATRCSGVCPHTWLDHISVPLIRHKNTAVNETVCHDNPHRDVTVIRHTC